MHNRILISCLYFSTLLRKAKCEANGTFFLVVVYNINDCCSKNLLMTMDFSYLIVVYNQNSIHQHLIPSLSLHHVLRSSTVIEHVFNSFLFSESSLKKKVLNTYLIKVDECDNDNIQVPSVSRALGQYEKKKSKSDSRTMSEDASSKHFPLDIFYTNARAVNRFRGCVAIFILVVVYMREDSNGYPMFMVHAVLGAEIHGQ